MISFVLDGDPVPKGRARFAKRGANVVAFTPAKTKNYEMLVSHAGWVAMNGQPAILGPVELHVDVVLAIPPSRTKKDTREALAGRRKPTARPDLDNFLKAVLDGLNGIAFKDDAQVVQIVAGKRYGEQPHIKVTVIEL